jgi:hypothetical protein
LSAARIVVAEGAGDDAVARLIAANKNAFGKRSRGRCRLRDEDNKSCKRAEGPHRPSIPSEMFGRARVGAPKLWIQEK